jgi:UrcA family protein
MTRILEKFTASAGAVALTVCVLFVSDARAAEMSAGSDGIAIKYAQEELNTEADAERLYGKLRQASRKACGIGGGFLNLPERTRAEKCAEQTLADVVEKINRPQLTALHESKSSKTKSG